MSFKPISSALNALSLSTSLLDAQLIEDSVHAGRNGLLTCVSQISQAAISLSFADELSLLKTNSYIPLWARAVTYITPAIIAYTISNELIENAFAHQLFTFAQDHYGTLCHIASLTSSVALIALGNVGFGLTSMAFLTVGALARYGILPHEIRRIIHDYLAPLGMIVGLTRGFGLDFVFNLISFLSFLAEKLQIINRPVVEINQALPYEQLQAIINGTVETEINPDFIQYATFPFAPDRNIQRIIEISNTIDWTKHQAAINRKLSLDSRFKHDHPNPDSVSNEEKIAYFKASLQDFITSIDQRQVLHGEPHSYERLTDYLKHIVAFIEAEEDEITKSDIILRLAIEGGRYCGSGKYEVIQSVFDQFYSERTQMDLRLKVLNCLRDFRMSIFDTQIFSERTMLAQQFAGSFFDFQDIHFRNNFIATFGHNLGLQIASAGEDGLASTNLITDLLNYPVRSQLETEFSSYHTQDAIIQDIITKSGSSVLPKPDIFSWWNEWAERNVQDQALKENLQDQILDGKFLNQPMEVEVRGTRIFKSSFIKAMLVDMGVLRIRPQ